MRPPEPVLVVELFPAERDHLLDLLAGLTPDQWSLPTACPGWSVKDIAAHLLADDLGRLSRGRDGFQGWSPRHGESLLTFINRQNDEWVLAARRLSPNVLVGLLRGSGTETASYFAALDPFALGGSVSWTGPEPAPLWLDLAREYTERWHHQQHIRDAVGAPLLIEPRFYDPVLATFVRALPHTFRQIAAAAGTSVQLTLAGASDADWAIVRDESEWTLYAGVAADPAARVTVDQTAAWRLFTNGLSTAEAEGAAQIEGNPRLGRTLLAAIAIIA